MRERSIAAKRRVEERFQGWVHESARGDSVKSARHASLIASHVSGAVMAGVVFAGLFVWHGTLGPMAAFAAVWFMSPLAVAIILSRTGHLGFAHFLSAVNLTGIVVIAATLSGGPRSFALIWLIIVPLEAALSTSRRMMIAATGLSLAALIAIHTVAALGLLPSPTALPIPAEQLSLASLLAAVAYGGALASSVQRIHRTTEQAIAESRASYRLIAENTTDLITRHNADGRITFASRASTAILGTSPSTLKRTGLLPFLGSAAHDRHVAAIQRAFAERKAISEEYELTFKTTTDGATVRSAWVEVRYQPVLADVAGAPGSLIAVMRDISHRKHEALTLAKARDEAETASRAKTAFIATMSHELRTPLNAIIGFSEILHRELLIKAREPQHAEYCRVIHESGEHLLGLVQDLIDISKIESGRYTVVAEPFEAHAIIRSAIETVIPMAAKGGVEIATAIDPTLPEVLADRRTVKQILLNLLSNAFKFTPDGGKVTVRAARQGPRVILEVSDTGIGIAPGHLAKIGQPFYQVDTSYARRNEGAGLGLSIVRGLVALNGGTFMITSEEGRGTRCTVALPADSNLTMGDTIGWNGGAGLSQAPAVLAGSRIAAGAEYRG